MEEQPKKTINKESSEQRNSAFEKERDELLAAAAAECKAFFDGHYSGVTEDGSDPAIPLMQRRWREACDFYRSTIDRMSLNRNFPKPPYTRESEFAKIQMEHADDFRKLWSQLRSIFSTGHQIMDVVEGDWMEGEEPTLSDETTKKLVAFVPKFYEYR